MTTTMERPMRAFDLQVTLEELDRIQDVIGEEAPAEVKNSFQVAKDYYHDRINDLLRIGVADSAAFLDEHVPGWASRITKPLNMGSVHGCILGQVFDQRLPENQQATGPRRFFGLLGPRKAPGYSSGFIAGANFLEERGYDDRPFVFSSYEAAPFWQAEISRRGA